MKTKAHLAFVRFCDRVRQGWDLCSSYRRQFILLAIVALGIQASRLSITYAFGVLIDGFRSRDPVWLYWHTGYVLATAVTATLLYIFHSIYFLKNVGYPIEGTMAVLPLRKMASLSMSDIADKNLAVMCDVVKNGQGAIRDAVEKIFTGLLPICFRLGIVIPGLFLENWSLGLIGSGCFAIYLFESYRINREIFPKADSHRRHGNQMEASFFAVLENFRLVKSVNYEETEIACFGKKYKAYCDEGTSLWVGYLREAALKMHMISAACLGSLVFASVFLFINGRISVGGAIVAVMWAWSAFDSMEGFGSLLRTYMQSKPAITEFLDLIKKPAAPKLQGTIRPKSALSGDIRIENVSFQHPRTAQNKGLTVSDISFNIEGGKVCALVGASGAGKSTLMNLLLGYSVPLSGRIRVGEYDLQDMDPKHWGNLVSYVDQSPTFWHGMSLRDNLVYGLNGRAKGITDSDIAEALKLAQLDGMVKRLGDDPFQVKIGKGGVGLSGGEWQRLAIARAMLRKPKFLFLDEPTSALDSQNAALVSDVVMKSAEGRTCIIITHRAETVMQADQIVVMDHGQLVATGTHSELNMTCQQYQRLVRHRFLITENMLMV